MTPRNPPMLVLSRFQNLSRQGRELALQIRQKFFDPFLDALAIGGAELRRRGRDLFRRDGVPAVAVGAGDRREDWRRRRRRRRRREAS